MAQVFIGCVIANRVPQRKGREVRPAVSAFGTRRSKCEWAGNQEATDLRDRYGGRGGPPLVIRSVHGVGRSLHFHPERGQHMRRMTLSATVLGMLFSLSTPLLAHDSNRLSAQTIAARQKYLGVDNVDAKTGAVRSDRVILSWVGVS